MFEMSENYFGSQIPKFDHRDSLTDSGAHLSTDSGDLFQFT